MINTRMTVPEMLKEYWKTWKELRMNCERYGKAIYSDLVKAQKKHKDNPAWWWEAAEPRQYQIGGRIIKEHGKTKKIGGNVYRVILKFRPIQIGRLRDLDSIIVTYSILTDTNTGKKLVILWPVSEKDNHLVLFDPKFFTEYQEQRFPDHPGMPFTDIVDDFMMRNNGECEIYTNAHTDPELAEKENNLEFKFTNGYSIGHAKIGEADAWRTYTAKHFFSVGKVEEMRAKVGGDDVLSLTPTRLWDAYQEAIAPKPKTVDIRYTEDYDWEEEQRKEHERILEELAFLDDY